MRKTLNTIAALFCVIAWSSSSHADITLNNFVGLTQDVVSGANTIQTGYAPSSGNNSVLFVTFSFDSPGDPTDAVTFGGVGLTKVETPANRIFFLPNPGTALGDIVLTTSTSGGFGNELFSVGTLEGVDTSSITALTGATSSGTIQSGPDFFALAPDSYVLTSFSANNHTGSYSAVAGNPILTGFDQGGSAFDGAVTGAAGVSGDFTPTIGGFTGSNLVTAVSIAFTPAAIPEPSSAGILVLAMAYLGVRRRRGLAA